MTSSEKIKWRRFQETTSNTIVDIVELSWSVLVLIREDQLGGLSISWCCLTSTQRARTSHGNVMRNSEKMETKDIYRTMTLKTSLAQ